MLPKQHMHHDTRVSEHHSGDQNDGRTKCSSNFITLGCCRLFLEIGISEKFGHLSYSMLL